MTTPTARGTTPTARPATCETPIYRQGVTRPCGQVVGLRSWYDSAGTLHRACPLHIAERLHRYPEADPPEPEWLHEAPEYADPVTQAKAYTDAGWTVAELAEAWGK